ncbi:hypothetical protein M2318_001960 [Metapseudomonas resinovorans]|uniref:hypothetical protein n=1 Tax=Metapseudomonas resinovorans TaxID=53412 RepID=UPI00237F5FC0|nr:hypothetical protein [Pseudomonas resinovorans]MDE3738702.1 hypothetical protein [Pseudomonas resinovorans]
MIIIKHLLLPLLLICCLLEFELARASGDLVRPAIDLPDQRFSLPAATPVAD